MSTADYATEQKTGVIAFVALVVLKIVEYAVAVAMPSGSFLPIAALAVVDGWIILKYFMHMPQLWHSEE